MYKSVKIPEVDPLGMQGCLDSIYVKKQKQQFMNLLDVYFSDLHIFGFYDTVITVFTFNFLVYYTDIKF